MAPLRVKRQKWIDQPKDYLPEGYLPQHSPAAVTQFQSSDPHENQQAAMAADAYAISAPKHAYGCKCDNCKSGQIDLTSSLDGPNLVSDDNQDPESRVRPCAQIEWTPKLLTPEDSFDQLPDCCPPTDNLGKNGVPRLEIRQPDSHHRTPLYYINDPHVVGMHEQERVVVAALRLTGARYLANKRRIFMHKIRCLSDNRPFIVVQAAEALSNIGHQKCHEMIAGFRAVGWLNDEHFLHAIPSVQEVPSIRATPIVQDPIVQDPIVQDPIFQDPSFQDPSFQAPSVQVHSQPMSID